MNTFQLGLTPLSGCMVDPAPLCGRYDNFVECSVAAKVIEHSDVLPCSTGDAVMGDIVEIYDAAQFHLVFVPVAYGERSKYGRY